MKGLEELNKREKKDIEEIKKLPSVKISPRAQEQG
jgi:hypothetical protein